jgi:hypothetical protein
MVLLAFFSDETVLRPSFSLSSYGNSQCRKLYFLMLSEGKGKTERARILRSEGNHMGGTTLMHATSIQQACDSLIPH